MASADSAEDDDEPTCRICFGGEEDGKLIEPCRCSGSMALIYRSCLDAVRVSGFDPASLARCGLCKEDYVLEGTGGGPRGELVYTVGRYLGLRFLALFAAAGLLGFTPRLIAAPELRVVRNPLLNHFSVGSMTTLVLTGGCAVVTMIGALNLANLSRGRWGSRRGKDESLQAMLILLVVVGLGYLVYHLATSTYRLMRTGVPVAIDNVRAANKRERERIAAKYPVRDRRAPPRRRPRRRPPPRAPRRWWLFGLGGAAAQSTAARRQPSRRQAIPPRFAQNLTLYHVNELSAGVVPRDMDTADQAGELFFDLRSVILPIECAGPVSISSAGSWAGDCQNLELTGTNEVVSKLIVEVDARFGAYGMCNECGSDGVDHFSKLPCTPGAYFCSCRHGFGFAQCDAQEEAKVGSEDITTTFERFLGCTWDQFMVRPWSCWSGAVLKKTGGTWYSTFAASEGSAWRVVRVEKVVTKACSDASIYGAVEAQDSVKCFDACGARNTSSPCWIGCFYRTILGAEGMLPTGAAHPGGMSHDSLAEAWEAPFASSDPSRGGCPPVAVANATRRE